MSRRLLLACDLDGTLIDSARDVATAASEMVASYGGRRLTLDEVTQMIGEGAGLLVRRALAAAELDPDTPDALARFLSIYDERLLDTTVPYPGVADMLLLASRRARLAVLTNKPLAPSIRIVERLGLAGYFEEIVGGDNALGRKPDPAALRALARDAERVALLGDSPIDAETARAAGCSFLWARYGFGSARFTASPDTPFVLDAPRDLARVLDRLTMMAAGA